jgi:hypothetical protein
MENNIEKNIEKNTEILKRTEWENETESDIVLAYFWAVNFCYW